MYTYFLYICIFSFIAFWKSYLYISKPSDQNDWNKHTLQSANWPEGDGTGQPTSPWPASPNRPNQAGWPDPTHTNLCTGPLI